MFVQFNQNSHAYEYSVRDTKVHTTSKHNECVRTCEFFIRKSIFLRDVIEIRRKVLSTQLEFTSLSELPWLAVLRIKFIVKNISSGQKQSINKLNLMQFMLNFWRWIELLQNKIQTKVFRYNWAQFSLRLFYFNSTDKIFLQNSIICLLQCQQLESLRRKLKKTEKKLFCWNRVKLICVILPVAI